MKYTHNGNVIGIAYRRGESKNCKFRELKNHWADEYNNKYSKINGYPIGEKFATWKLDINSLVAIILN